MADDGLRLARGRAAPAPATLADVNDALTGYGARIWPLDISSLGADHRRLLDAPTLHDDEAASLRARHMPPARHTPIRAATQAPMPVLPEKTPDSTPYSWSAAGMPPTRRGR